MQHLKVQHLRVEELVLRMNFSVVSDWLYGDLRSAYSMRKISVQHDLDLACDLSLSFFTVDSASAQRRQQQLQQCQAQASASSVSLLQHIRKNVYDKDNNSLGTSDAQGDALASACKHSLFYISVINGRSLCLFGYSSNLQNISFALLDFLLYSHFYGDLLLLLFVLLLTLYFTNAL